MRQCITYVFDNISYTYIYKVVLRTRIICHMLIHNPIALRRLSKTVTPHCEYLFQCIFAYFSNYLNKVLTTYRWDRNDPIFSVFCIALYNINMENINFFQSTIHKFQIYPKLLQLRSGYYSNMFWSRRELNSLCAIVDKLLSLVFGKIKSAFLFLAE